MAAEMLPMEVWMQQNIYRAARISRGLTQEAAAAKIPINVRSLREYESGERVPNSDTVVRMSEIYDAQYLCYQHLRQTSEIAQRLIPDTGDLALPEAVLQLLDAVYAFADNKTDRRLIAIARDGVIDEQERPEYDRIVEDLQDIIKYAMAVSYRQR
jgi:transcriptional regulator with XRE-family HTH domain